MEDAEPNLLPPPSSQKAADASSELGLIKDQVSPDQLFVLDQHLLNQCPDFSIDILRGERPRRVELIGAAPPVWISKGIMTLYDRVPVKKRVGFVPHCHGPWSRPERSRWAGLRFTDVGGAVTEAQVKRAFNVFRRGSCHYAVGLEDCGDRTWQIWVIAPQFLKFECWLALLHAAQVASGVLDGRNIEIFPDPAHPQSRFDRGMRSPGAWNHATNAPSRIIFENLNRLLRHLYGR